VNNGDSKTTDVESDASWRATADAASAAPTSGGTSNPSTERSPSPTPSPVFVLALALVGISLAAPLTRLSAAPALVVAAWRLGFSLVIIALALIARGEWRALRSLRSNDLLLTTSAGLLLAVHFWSWNVSLRYTSVAASVSLVNLQPVIIALFSARWLGEPATKRQWTGIAIAVCGALVVGLSDVPGGVSGLFASLAGGTGSTSSNSGIGAARSTALLGDLLAAVGAVAGAFYFLIGRRVRQTLSLWPYVALVYSAAFVTCCVLSVLSGTPLVPQPPGELAIFAALALGPMLLGHTGMNWALGHLPAYLVNLTTLGEPIGATLLAALLPGIHEVPSVGTIVGGAVVLVGVLRAARR